MTLWSLTQPGVPVGLGKTGGRPAAFTAAVGIAAGWSLLDTIEAYGPLVDEELVGEATAPFSDRVLIAVRFGDGRRWRGYAGVRGRR